MSKEKGKDVFKKDILESILDGDRITETVKTKRGDFVIAYPLPHDLRLIDVEVAKRLEGQPQDSFSRAQVTSFRCYATLDYIIVENPEWWDKLNSSEDCPDDELVTSLYRRYLRFYEKIQRKVGASKFGGRTGGSKSKNSNEVVGD